MKKSICCFLPFSEESVAVIYIVYHFAYAHTRACICAQYDISLYVYVCTDNPVLMSLRGVGKGEGYEEIFYISTEEGIDGVIYIDYFSGRVRAGWYT